jgi:hypothetical protein
MLGLYQGSSTQSELQRALGRIERLGGSKRFWELDRLEQYYRGTQHDGKTSWWDGSKPARERKPCVLSGLPKAAVEQAVRFTLGEGKFPTLSFMGSEEALSIGGATIQFSAEDGKALDALWLEVVEQAGLKLSLREGLRRGLSARTACGVYAVRDGEVAIELFNAKHCEPTWASPTKKELARLECRYIYPVEERRPDGTTEEVWYWYRRVVDTARDVIYEPVKVEEGDEPNWTEDKEQTTDHGLGFCPAFWWPNLTRMDVVDDDGVALFDECEDEIDAIDYSLSMRHTGVFVWGSPQPWQTGVMAGEGPEAGARKAVDIFNTTDGSQVGFINPNAPARERSAFNVWTFEEADVKVGLLEQSGTAATAVTEHVSDLRARLLESIQVVLVDPLSVAGRGDMSAKLLELLYAPLLALVDDLRECWGSHLRALAHGVLRMLLTMGKRDPGAVYLTKLGAALPVLERFLLKTESDRQRFVRIPSALTWGDYFSPTNADVRDAVVTAKSALGEATAGGSGSGADAASAPLIATRTARKYVASFFGVVDLDAEEEAIEEEVAEREKKAAEQAKTELDAALTQIGAKAGAKRPGEDAAPFAAGPGGDSGRAKGGQKSSDE